MKSIQRFQKFIRYYKQVTGVTDVNMKEVAKLAKKMGWQLPLPVDPLELLARKFANAARQEIRHDKATGKPYRVYHWLKEQKGGQQLSFWVDIDEAPRKRMVKSMHFRRDQMIGDGYQLTLDADHWNRIHPDEEPIPVELDLTDEVAWRKNAPDNGQKASYFPAQNSVLGNFAWRMWTESSWRR